MKTTAIEKKMIGRLHGIYSRKGIGKEEKEAMLLDLTDGRTCHTNELTHKESIYLWGYLNGQTASSGYDPIKTHRSGCLKIMQKIGVDTTDWNAINSYCLDKRTAGSVFYDLTIDDLKKLRKRLEKILKKKENG